MRYLVFCACGHALERHGQEGCEGEDRRRCACERDPGRALEAAIDDVRSRPWSSAEVMPAER